MPKAVSGRIFSNSNNGLLRLKAFGRSALFGNRSWGILASSLCLLAQFPLSGCYLPNHIAPDISVHFETQPDPPRVGPNVIVVKLSKMDDVALSGAHVSLEADMAHPGMSPAMGELKEAAAGTYRGELNLAMRGDWILEFHIALADGRKVERTAELKNVKE